MTEQWRRASTCTLLAGIFSFPAAAMAVTAASHLTDYSLQQIDMVGTINNNQQIWGIVRTPDQQVYRVTIGNEVGKEHAHIVQVTGQRITVEYTTAEGQLALQTLWLKKAASGS